MKINWFPGHMNKALKDIADQHKKVDVVLYLLDARIPISSKNPSLSKLIENKPVLYVVNKVDMADSKRVQNISQMLQTNTSDYILYNSTLSGKSDQIISKIKSLCKDQTERYKAKGVRKTVRAMVIGVPNCGKSTLINSLVPQKKAMTGNRPGVTRGKQWVSIDDYVELLDTPGTLFPDFSDQKKATFLALAGCIKDNIVDQTELSLEILDFLKENYPKELKEKYSIEDLSVEPLALLQCVAKRRGYVMRGGELDVERASVGVIQDFRKQAFGKIILEKYERKG